jgi:hypothetical protein
MGKTEKQKKVARHAMHVIRKNWDRNERRERQNELRKLRCAVEKSGGDVYFVRDHVYWDYPSSEQAAAIKQITANFENPAWCAARGLSVS